ncbi:MAG: hypothetical protein HY288_19960 [Planctomycetia bacterium]|nr:hypothetical protein [Planctomycetia bacterium]
MKTHRNRYGVKTRSFGKKSSRTSAFKRLSIASVERLEIRTMLTSSPLQNPLDRWDVNNDGHVTAADALTVVNQLMSGGSQTAPSAAPMLSALALTTSTDTSSAGSSTTQTFTDVNGDGQVTASDLLSVINQLAAPNPNAIFEYRLEVEDTLGNPISSIAAGQDFQLAAFVHDLRTPTAPHPGVFAGFVNVAYDALATIPAGTAVAHSSLIIHGATVSGFYTLTPAGDLSTVGQILGAGGADQKQNAEDNPAEQPLWTVHMHAATPGVENFTSSFDTTSLPPPAGTNSGHDSLLYGIDPSILADQIQFDTAQLTITPSTSVSISPANISLGEAASVTTPFLFTVSLSGPALTQNATVVFSTGGGLATANVDYLATSGTLTFTPGGPTTTTIAVTGIDDQLSESDETFSVSLSAPTTVGLGTSTAVGTILDDDPLPTVNITTPPPQNDGSASTTMLFTVNLSAASGQQATVKFTTADGTATVAAQDYVATSGTLTFAPGETRQVITVTILGDSAPELDESFNVVLSQPGHLTLGTATAVGTLLNDDFPTVIVSNVSQLEGNSESTPFVFTVSLSQPTPSEVTVAYTTADGNLADSTRNATLADNDFQQTSGIVTFAPNATMPQLVTVLVNGDTVNEKNETFRVLFSDPTNAVIGGTGPLAATSIILNDDGPRVTITSPPTIITAPQTGTTNAVFTVNLLAQSAIPVLVTYTTHDGLAPNGATTADDDYVAQSDTLTFLTGETSRDITITVNAESRFEPDESFSVNLTGVVDDTATIQQATAAATIHSDVTPPTLSFSASQFEVTSSTTAATLTPLLFTVNLSAPAAAPVLVAFQTADDTATTAASDYLAASGTLTFVPNSTQQVITVQVLGSTLHEADEDFLVNLTAVTNLPQLVAPIVATGLIHNPNPVPTVSINDVSHTEPHSGQINYVFTVTLSSGSDQQILVNYETADDTAKVADGDYASTSGILTFAPGQLTRLITVVANGDLVNEANEKFDVNLTTSEPASKVTIADAQGVGTLVNDIAGPIVSISNVSLGEGDSGSTPFVFTVSLSAASGQDITVAYTTVDGTATTAGSDYVGQASTLTFTAGTTVQLITVTVNGDTLNEANETFKVNLTGATIATISATQGSATGTILNDDPLPSVSIVSTFSHAEGDSGSTPFVINVSLSTISGQQVTVAYSTADGTAKVSSNDYQATSGVLTFNPGVTSQGVTVMVKGDLFQEGNETFFVNLSNPPSNATLQTGQATVTIVDELTDNIKFTPSTIAGSAFVDTNGDGKLNNGETRLANIPVTLTGTPADSTTVVTVNAVTAADGSYQFTDLAPGTYQVTYPQPAHFLPAQVLVSHSDNFDGHVTTDGTGLVLNAAISFPGGVNATGTNLTVRGLDPKSFSTLDLWRLFHPSSTQSGSTVQQAAGAQSLAAAPAAGAVTALATTDSTAGLFTQSGSTVTVHGTAGDDNFEFTAGAVDTVKINGVTRTFDPTAVTAIIFDGGTGKNTAKLTGSTGDDVAALGLGSGTLTGAHFTVSVNNVSSLTVNGGGGHDTATLQDSALSDHLRAAGDGATLSNDLGFLTSLMAFSQVQAKSTNGATDTAHVDAIDFALQELGNWLAV